MLTSLFTPVPIGPVECIGAFCPNPDGSGGPTQIELLITTVLGFLTIVGGLTFLIYFVIGGISWITAGGDSGKVDKAKTMMTNALIGMVVIVVAYGVTWVVGKVLGLNILNPAQTLLDMVNGSSGSNPPPVVSSPNEPY